MVLSLTLLAQMFQYTTQEGCVVEPERGWEGQIQKTTILAPPRTTLYHDSFTGKCRDEDKALKTQHKDIVYYHLSKCKAHMWTNFLGGGKETMKTLEAVAPRIVPQTADVNASVTTGVYYSRQWENRRMQ